MSEDRRATIETALDAEDSQEGQTVEKTSAPTPASAPRESADSQAVASPSQAATAGTVTTPALAPEASSESDQVGEGSGKTYVVDKPPQSWRPAQKAKWAALDPEVRQEVIRRERDMERTLGSTVEARQLHQSFTQAVNPYMARIASLGVQPVAAVVELLRADHLLTTAPKT